MARYKNDDKWLACEIQKIKEEKRQDHNFENSSQRREFIADMKRSRRSIKRANKQYWDQHIQSQIQEWEL